MNRTKGVILSYISLIIEVASGVLFTPFLIRMFGQAEYGVYGLVLTITSYMSLLDLGVGNSIVRYSAKYRVNGENDKQRKLLGVTIIFYSVIALIVLGIGLFVSNNVSLFFSTGLSTEELQRARIMLIITFINAAVTMWLYSFSKVIVAYEKFTITQGLLIGRIILKVVVLIPILLLGGKGIAVVIVDCGLTVVVGAIYIYYVLVKLKVAPKFSEIDRSFVKEIVGYSTFIFIQMIATQLNAMVDQILIAAIVPASAVVLALYSLGSQISSYIQRIAAAINGVLMPGAVRLVEKGASSDEIEKEMVRIGRIIFIILAGVFINIIYFGRAFIKLYAGDDYAMSYWVVLLITFPMVLSLPQSIGTQILWAKDKHKTQAILKLAIALCNILLTIVLIKWQPLIGASLGTCIALMLGDVLVMNIVFRKDLKIHVFRYYRYLLKGTFFALAGSSIIGLVLKQFETGTFLNFFINCTILTLTYGVQMLLFGFSSYEKSLVKKILHKISVLRNL